MPRNGGPPATPTALRAVPKPRELLACARTALSMALNQVVPLRGVLAALAGVAAATLGGLYLLSLATGTPMALLTRDVAATTGTKFYIGILSSVGALVWCAAASVCLFGAAALRGVSGQGERASFLTGMGVLLSALGADDFFMLHEVVYPKFGLQEEVLVVLYALSLIGLMVRFRAQLLASEVLLFLIGAVLFTGSVITDFFVRDSTALEDLLKVGGVACWLVYFWRHALAGVREGRR